MSVGFVGRVSRIAHVHQDGATDRARPGGPMARYEKRVLLGLTANDRRLINDRVLSHFG
ncbi:Phage virion morphogenesis protein (fragment) [Xanthomonas citri pv. citri]